MTSLSYLCLNYYHISFPQRERNTTYLRRWFVLKGNLLFYQERPGDRNLLGVIVLEGCMVQACETGGQFCFSLVFTGPGLRTYRLAADDHHSQESWIGALFCASHIYLSMIVRDLERRYQGVFMCFVCVLCGCISLKAIISSKLNLFMLSIKQKLEETKASVIPSRPQKRLLHPIR